MTRLWVVYGYLGGDLGGHFVRLKSPNTVYDDPSFLFIVHETARLRYANGCKEFITTSLLS